jgi:hypothetical protein
MKIFKMVREYNYILKFDTNSIEICTSRKIQNIIKIVYIFYNHSSMLIDSNINKSDCRIQIENKVEFIRSFEISKTQLDFN